MAAEVRPRVAETVEVVVLEVVRHEGESRARHVLGGGDLDGLSRNRSALVVDTAEGDDACPIHLLEGVGELSRGEGLPILHSSAYSSRVVRSENSALKVTGFGTTAPSQVNELPEGHDNIVAFIISLGCVSLRGSPLSEPIGLLGVLCSWARVYILLVVDRLRVLQASKNKACASVLMGGYMHDAWQVKSGLLTGA